MFIIMVAADWAQGFRSPIARVYNMRSVPVRLASKGASNFVVMDKLNEIMQFFLARIYSEHAVDALDFSTPAAKDEKLHWRNIFSTGIERM